MLTAAIEAGGLNGDERPAHHHTATSGSARHRVCPAVDAHAGARAHRVHRASICVSRGGGSVGVERRCGGDDRHRSRVLGPKRVGALRLQRINQPRVRRRSRCHLWSRDLAPRTQLRCGSCGRPMGVGYPSGNAMYDCCHSRSDHTKTPGCRGVMAATIDAAVAQRVLAVVTPAGDYARARRRRRGPGSPGAEHASLRASRRAGSLRSGEGGVCVPSLRTRESSGRSQS
jgi:hypothetical protein